MGFLETKTGIIFSAVGTLIVVLVIFEIFALSIRIGNAIKELKEMKKILIDLRNEARMDKYNV